MKIKELIARLKKFDQELEVVYQNPACDFDEAVILDSAVVKSAVKQADYDLYFKFVPDDLNSPCYPELKFPIQQVLLLCL